MLSAVEVRRRRIWGVLSVLLGIGLILVAMLAITGKLGATSAAPSTDGAIATDTGSAPATDTGSEPPPSETTEPPTPTSDPDLKAPLTVLNGGGTAGLAGRGRDAFVEGGWEVSEVGNLSSGIPEQSTVFYPPGDETAKNAAENLAKQFPDLAVAETPEAIKVTGVVVVLTGDWDPGQN